MILILGGTSEARALAAALVERGEEVLSCLAGRVSDPALPAGPVRIGGFGGVHGLTAFLRDRRVRAVVDATHPFAARISANAAIASADSGVPLLRLVRPSWRDRADAHTWTWVAMTAEVLDAAPCARRPFLTTGRQSLQAFLPWSDRSVLARVVDPPNFRVPTAWRIVRSRGPYVHASEYGLMDDHRVDLLVTKDSGGSHTAAKLTAAAELGIPVVVIARPGEASARPGPGGFVSVEEVLVALETSRLPQVLSWSGRRGLNHGGSSGRLR